MFISINFVKIVIFLILNDDIEEEKENTIALYQRIVFVMTGTFQSSGFLGVTHRQKVECTKAIQECEMFFSLAISLKTVNWTIYTISRTKATWKRTKKHTVVSKRMNKRTNEWTSDRGKCYEEKWSINNYAIINSLIRIEVLMRQLTMVVYLLNVVCSRNVCVLIYSHQ